MNLRAKKLLALGIGLFLSLSAFAQNYLPSYIVSLKGDTTKGLINYKNWRKNPNSIQFKKDDNGEMITYTAKDIAAFGITLTKGTETYKSALVEIDSSSNNLDQLDRQRAFNNRTDQLFLLTLLKGTYNLYVYVDHKTHFFIENGNEITELKFKTYYLGEKKYVKENQQYKVQLTTLLKDCPKITSNAIINLTYQEQDLIKILKKYDECKGAKTENTLIQERAKFTFGAVLATDITSLKIKKDQARDFKINSTGNFAIGLSAELKFPRNNRSSSFNLELLYRHYKFENRDENIISNDEYFKYHYDFEGNYARLNFMYRYQWTLTKLKPFVNIGVAQGLKFSDIDKSTTENKFYTAVTNYHDPIVNRENAYEQGVNLGLGINVNKINIELRAETTNGFSHLTNIKTSINSLFLNLNYLF